MKSRIGGHTIALFAALMLSAYGCGSSGSTGGSSSGSGPRSQAIEASDTNIVTTVAEMSTGDMLYVDFDASNSAVIDFSGASDTSKYTLIIQQPLESSSTVGISKQISTQTPKMRLDDALRANEAMLAANARPLPAANASLAKGVEQQVSLGDIESFRVLSSLSSLAEYDTVSGEVKCIKENNIVLYVDVDIPESDLSDQDIAALCDDFDYAVSTEKTLLGEPSDVNNDGLVAVLITLGVNRLGASGGGIVTGYFYASDLYSRTQNNPVSNHREILYILAPDPNGSDGAAISKDFAMSNLMTAVVPHELQHAINYNQHVFVNGGTNEVSWLNEALSHFAEDIVGFGQENPSRVEIFLNYPESTSLIPSGSPNLAARGAEYLFMRFLYEQASDGAAFLHDLYNTSLTGADNVLAAFGTTDASLDTWNELMRRWAIAIYMTNAGITLTEQYMFQDRIENQVTGNMQGVCLICNAADNRGTELLGPYINEFTDNSMDIDLAGTSTAYFSIPTPPDQLALAATTSGHQAVLIRIE